MSVNITQTQGNYNSWAKRLNLLGKLCWLKVVTCINSVKGGVKTVECQYLKGISGFCKEHLDGVLFKKRILLTKKKQYEKFKIKRFNVCYYWFFFNNNRLIFK